MVTDCTLMAFQDYIIQIKYVGWWELKNERLSIISEEVHLYDGVLNTKDGFCIK